RSEVVFSAGAALVFAPARAGPSRALALFFFLPGFRPKPAGTEMGVIEPQPTFSTCFGPPFLPQHPEVYAGMLREKLERHGSTVWLLNTGWTGGAFGEGERMPIHATRTMLSAVLSGAMDDAELRPEGVRGLRGPSARARGEAE